MIHIWNLSTDAPANFDLGDVQINAVALSPDGHLLLCVGTTEFFIVDVESGRIVFRRNAEEHFEFGEWSSSGDRAGVCSTAGESVFVFDPTGRSICEISHGADMRAFAFSPSGSTVAVVGDKYLQIASSTDGRTVHRRPLDALGHEVTYSHDGSRIACGGDDGRIVLFDGATLQAVHELESGSAAYCLAFSPNDSILASGHRDSTIRTWETETGRMLGELVGHEQVVLCVAYSPDGRTLLSTGSDGAARVWSLDHNRAFGAFHRRPSNDALTGKCRLSLSSNGRYLALGYEFADAGTSNILLWNLHSSAND